MNAIEINEILTNDSQIPNQTYLTKSNLVYQAYWTKPTKPKLLVKAVNAWVRSAFVNVFRHTIRYSKLPCT